MRKAVLLISALALGLGGLSPAPAGAGHCEPANEIYVFSFTQVRVDDETAVSNPSIVSEAIGCTVLTEGDNVDTRYIYPGANIISVRYYGAGDADLGINLTGRLNGLGFEDFSFELRREPGIGGLGFNYDSDAFEIDPTVGGVLNVEVDIPIGEDESGRPVFFTQTDVYRTADQDVL